MMKAVCLARRDGTQVSCSTGPGWLIVEKELFIPDIDCSGQEF